jgi:hypothetical protein
MASALLFGFVGANVFAWMCLGTTLAAPSGAASMAGCDMETMEMPDAEGIGVSAFYDCCLSCIAEAGLLDTYDFELPPAVPVPDGFDVSVRDFVLPAPNPPSERVVPPQTSPPVFLLTGSLLI